MESGWIWTSETKYIDIDTGEILKKGEAQNKTKYIKIKTLKYAERKETIRRGHIQWTILCRRNPQQRITFGGI